MPLAELVSLPNYLKDRKCTPPLVTSICVRVLTRSLSTRAATLNVKTSPNTCGVPSSRAQAPGKVEGDKIIYYRYAVSALFVTHIYTIHTHAQTNTETKITKKNKTAHIEKIAGVWFLLSLKIEESV